MSEFNLLDEPFILAQYADEQTREVSLKQVFPDARDIRTLSGDIPTQGFAVLRMLLAICHDALDIRSKRAWRDMWRSGLDIERIQSYLESYRDRFFLFDDHRPFMQVANLHTSKDHYSGLEKLIADVPNGLPFFTTRIGRGLERISAAEAARWVIHVHAFDPSGIRSGVVGDPNGTSGRSRPIGPGWAGRLGGLVVHGDTLLDTLMLNLTPAERSSPEDRPVWALDRPQTPAGSDYTGRQPAGPVSLLVWQSRRVRLVGDSSGVTGLVLTNGDKMTPQNRQDYESMTAWRYSEPQSKKFGQPTYMPNKHDPDRSLWRNLPTLIDVDLRADGQARYLPARTVRQLEDIEEGLSDRIRLQAIGMSYGTQEATIEEITNDLLDLSVSVLGEQSAAIRAMIADAVEATEMAVRALGNLAANLARAGGERGDTAGQGERDRALQRAWAAIDQPCREWLGSLSATTPREEALTQWQNLVRELLMAEAQSILGQCSTAAIEGRWTRGRTGDVYLTAALSELWFRSALAKALPHAAINRTTYHLEAAS